MTTLDDTARSSYMLTEDSMAMLPLDEDGSGGGVAATVQSAEDRRSAQ
jgi:hypothetical protein